MSLKEQRNIRNHVSYLPKVKMVPCINYFSWRNREEPKWSQINYFSYFPKSKIVPPPIYHEEQWQVKWVIVPWETMRIHNQIRTNAFLRKWKVFLRNNSSTNTFLPMSAAKFITKLMQQIQTTNKYTISNQ